MAFRCLEDLLPQLLSSSRMNALISFLQSLFTHLQVILSLPLALFWEDWLENEATKEGIG